MSTCSGRGLALRSYRRRKVVLDLDLNSAPPGENQEQGGPSTESGPQVVEGVQHPQVVQPIDVEAIDDDVVESTPRAFAEARNNSRRNRGRTIVDVDLEDRNRGENAPVPQPVFNCPICMGPFVEEMSTRCGHIFCRNCIKAAIRAQAKCPTCRKKVTVKELIRVFLPSTS